MTKAEIIAALNEQLSVPLWPIAGTACGFSRNTTYQTAQRGEFPGAFRVGNNWRVSTSTLRRTLGLDQQQAA
jgi:hypothetical protein